MAETGTNTTSAEEAPNDWTLPGEKPLPIVNLRVEHEKQEFLIEDAIPMENVTLATGDGEAGKSTIAGQLCGSVVVCGAKWLGIPVNVHGPALFVSCEEAPNVLWQRFSDVARDLNTTVESLQERGLVAMSFVAEDSLLAEEGSGGRIELTRLGVRIWQFAQVHKPKLIVIDGASDTFDGNEIVRRQVRRFITMLRAMAMDCHCAVVLLAHVSQAGKASGDGYSGSTGWHNSVRGRLYLTHPKEAKDETLRELAFLKNNYGTKHKSVLLRWQFGVFVVEGEGSYDDAIAQVRMNELFLQLLRETNTQGRRVSANRGPTYAPTVFAEMPAAKAAKADKTKLAGAMERLFSTNKIVSIETGPPSKPRSHIEEASGRTNPPDGSGNSGHSVSEPSGVGSNGAFQHPSNTPSNTLPTASNGGVPHSPPIPPSPVLEGEGGVGRTPALPRLGHVGGHARARDLPGTGADGDPFVEWEESKRS